MQLRFTQSLVLALFAGTLLAFFAPHPASAEPLCNVACAPGQVNLQSESAPAAASFSRFSLHVGTANLAEQKAIIATQEALFSSYRFTNLVVGVGYQPTQWLRFRASYTSNLNSASEIEHEAGESLPGTYSNPYYESTTVSLRARALRYGRWQVDAVGALFERSIDVGSRTMDNSIYSIHELDPVTSSETGMSAGVNVGFELRSWAGLAVSYQRLALNSMDFGWKHGGSNNGEGERAELSMQLKFPDKVSLHGQLSAESTLARGKSASYQAYTNEASIQLRLGF